MKKHFLSREVYVLLRGERYEGSEVIGVFYRREDARAEALKTRLHGEYAEIGNWKPDSEGTEDYWEDDTQYVEIITREIR